VNLLEAQASVPWISLELPIGFSCLILHVDWQICQRLTESLRST
jgi:hypothetical protein